MIRDQTTQDQTTQDRDEGPLHDWEVNCLVMAILLTRRARGDGATEEEMEELIEWAARARADNSALDMVLDGEIAVDVIDGKVHLRLNGPADRAAFGEALALVRSESGHGDE